MGKHYKYDLKRDWFGLRSARMVACELRRLGYKKSVAGSWGSKTSYVKHDRKIAPKDQKYLAGYMACLVGVCHLVDEDS